MESGPEFNDDIDAELAALLAGDNGTEEEIEIDQELVDLAGDILGAHMTYASPGDRHISAFSRADDDDEPVVAAFETDEDSVPVMLAGLHDYLFEQLETAKIIGLSWYGATGGLEPSDVLQRERINCALWRTEADTYNVFYVDYSIDDDGVVELGDVFSIAEKPGPMVDDSWMQEPDDMLEEAIDLDE